MQTPSKTNGAEQPERKEKRQLFTTLQVLRCVAAQGSSLPHFFSSFHLSTPNPVTHACTHEHEHVRRTHARPSRRGLPALLPPPLLQPHHSSSAHHLLLRSISPLRISQPLVRPPSSARCVTAPGAPRVVRDSEIWSEDSDFEVVRRRTVPTTLETIVEEQTPRAANSSAVGDSPQADPVTSDESSSSDSELVSDDTEPSVVDSPTGFVVGPHIPVGNLAVHFNGEPHKRWAHALRYKHDLNRQLYLPEIWLKDMCLGCGKSSVEFR